MKRILSVVFALAFISSAGANQTTKIFQFNGAVQCYESSVVSLETSAQELEAAGLKVIAKEVKNIPYGIAEKCGVPTGEVNVFTIDSVAWANFAKKNPGTLGYGKWVFDQQHVLVYKYDGSLQCKRATGISIDTMANELGRAGIKIVASRKGRDELEHIAVCGASTGLLNVYTIPIESLEEAKKLGFRGLTTQTTTREIVPAAARRGSVQSRSIPSGMPPKNTPIPRLW